MKMDDINERYLVELIDKFCAKENKMPTVICGRFSNLDRIASFSCFSYDDGYITVLGKLTFVLDNSVELLEVR